MLALFLSIFTSSAEHADVVQEDGKINFADGDCYFRKTRVKVVLQGPLFIRDFESYGLARMLYVPHQSYIVALGTNAGVAENAFNTVSCGTTTGGHWS